MRDTLRHLSRFLVVMILVDFLGLGLWVILPASAGFRQYVLLGTLVVAPLVAFLLTYGSEFEGA
ncbi:hypothetical protein C474_12166 [Halogeometricum pallidum JCM 14848]|uniref:Uncharacterized protein n=1 Tax=Halogeometricum pallidum JCM 14848 TaxID=1227487 RepID=M0D4K9_HALPD|nr:hypothetical protein [Halogeometricum pallidum]ELZ29788.1 hypothetical protein C474_12166 [Halogeometricum pallidum JCM 14848]